MIENCPIRATGFDQERTLLVLSNPFPGLRRARKAHVP